MSFALKTNQKPIKMNFRLSLLASLVTCSFLFANTQVSAQESSVTSEAADSLNGKIENLKSDIELIKRLKVTGYIQAQWQLADTAGAVTPYSGGAFPISSDNRFNIRRGRVKFTYENELSTYVLQLDATEKGLALKDAYIAIKDPWAQFVTLTAGVFDRPFGYEISYSSSMRETPERSRLFQSLFPGERDLGAKITLQPKKGTQYDWIRLDAGLFNGNGINPEFDSKKDFIGHLSFAKANRAETFKYGGGISFYNGGVFQGTKYVYSPGAALDISVPGLVDSTSSNKNSYAKRQYLGFDVQFSLQSALGFTNIRAEYITGKQPGSKNSNVSPSSLAAGKSILDYDTYNRNFNGGYIYFIQGIGQTKNQLVLKYDWLDPNTKVSGTEIASKSSAGKSTALGTADIKFNTIGFGWNYRFNSQIKLMAYYEIVKNENTALPSVGLNRTLDTSKDLKDNVFTLRVQYKF
jgi:phosphate-selective porin